MRIGRGRLSLWLAAAGALLAVGGLAGWQPQETRGPSGAVASAAGPVGAGSPAVDPAAAAPVLVPRQPGMPRGIEIPALGVTARVVPVRSTHDTLVPPADPQQLGWWADGARPGAKRGSALVTGHTVHTGGGALDDLEQLTPGERVVVRTDGARIAYRVERVRIYTKARLSEHSQRLFSQEVPGRLVLVTCEDWDGARYLSNVVVIATPVAG